MRCSWYPLLGLIVLTAWVAGCNPAPEPNVESPSNEELAPPPVDLSPGEPDASAESASPGESASTPGAANTPPASGAAGAAGTSQEPAAGAPPAGDSATGDDPSGDAAAADSAADAAQPSDAEQNDLLALELQLRELLDGEKYTEAIALLETKVKEDDPNPNLLVLLIQLHRVVSESEQKEGHIEAAREHALAAHAVAQKLLTLDLPFGTDELRFFATDFINAAAAYAVQEKPDLAIEALRKALELGVDDFEALEENQDLAGLLASNPELKTEIEQAAQAQREQFREELKAQMASFEPVALDFTLPNLEDVPVSLADYRGKVVVADIWGTWCKPCRMALPHFVRLHQEWGEKGLQVVGLTYEGDEYTVEATRTSVDPVKSEFGIGYPLLVCDQEVLNKVNTNAFPTTLLIDRNGKLRLSMIGVQPYARLEEGIKLLLEEEVAAEQADSAQTVN